MRSTDPISAADYDAMLRSQRARIALDTAQPPTAAPEPTAPAAASASPLLALVYGDTEMVPGPRVVRVQLPRPLPSPGVTGVASRTGPKPAPQRSAMGTAPAVPAASGASLQQSPAAARYRSGRDSMGRPVTIVTMPGPGPHRPVAGVVNRAVAAVAGPLTTLDAASISGAPGRAARASLIADAQARIANDNATLRGRLHAEVRHRLALEAERATGRRVALDSITDSAVASEIQRLQIQTAFQAAARDQAALRAADRDQARGLTGRSGRKP